MAGKLVRVLGIVVVVSVVLSLVTAMASDEGPLSLALDAVTALGRSLASFAEQLEQHGFDPEILFSGSIDIENKLETVSNLAPPTDAVPPADWATFLAELTEKITAIDNHVTNWNPDTAVYITLLTEAKAITDPMEEILQADDWTYCPNGRVLIIVYPGFTCDELIRELDERLAAGWCIIVEWREHASDDPHVLDPDDPPGPTQWRLYDCVKDYPLGSFVHVQSFPDPGVGFIDTIILGDPATVPHTSLPPVDPHPAYDGLVVELDDNPNEPGSPAHLRALALASTILLTVGVGEVCEETSLRWDIYDPAGILVEMAEITIDPAEEGEICVEPSRKQTEIYLDPRIFGPPGNYSAELWINDTFSALHSLAIAGPPPAAPIVMNETYWLPPGWVYANASVLANDLDPNHQTLIVEMDTEPQFGEVELRFDGTFTYTPRDPGFEGVDSFGYTVTDTDGMMNKGTATLIVTEMANPRTQEPSTP